MTTYSYTKTPIAIDRLTKEINTSAIITALDHMNLFGAALDIIFKADLSDGDKTILDGLVAAHDGTPLPSNASTPVEVVNTPVVTTQFELRNKTLKLAHGVADVDGTSGIATILLKIPGTPGSADGRWISSGIAFFDIHTPGDVVTGVYFTDEDNILGGGSGTVIGSYTDDDADAINHGWAIPPNGWVQCEAIGGYGFAPAGFYIKIIAKKAGDSPSGKFYCNFEWGKTEA